MTADFMTAMRLLVQMEERRNDLRRCFPKSFRENMDLAIFAIRARSKSTGEDEVQASLALAKYAAAKGEDVAAQFYACAPAEMAGL